VSVLDDGERDPGEAAAGGRVVAVGAFGDAPPVVLAARVAGVKLWITGPAEDGYGDVFARLVAEAQASSVLTGK